METLRVFGVPVEGVESVEPAIVLIIVTRTEIFHLETGIELLSCIQQVSGTLFAVRYAWIASEHLAVGVVGVIGRDSAIISG